MPPAPDVTGDHGEPGIEPGNAGTRPPKAACACETRAECMAAACCCCAAAAAAATRT